jgi:tetratricopeptide (TPR) repeat protein
MEAYNNKNYKVALEQINHAINLNKDMAKFYQLKGEIYKAQANYSQALIVFNQALKKRSNFIAVHESIGEIYQIQGKIEEAIRAYKRLIALESKRIDVILKIVRCYIILNELEVAQHHLDLYVNNAEDYHLVKEDEYYYLRGEILYKLKKFEESLSYLKKINRPSPEELKLQGLTYYGLGDYETGVTYFNKLLNLDKDNAEWYFYRGIYFYQKDDLNDALTQFKHAFTLDPGMSETRYYLGKIYFANRNFTAALEELEAYIKTNPETANRDDANDIIIKIKTNSSE